jgi:hypothetical protein
MEPDEKRHHVEANIHCVGFGIAGVSPGPGKLGAAGVRRVVLLVLVQGIAAQLS